MSKKIIIFVCLLVFLVINYLHLRSVPKELIVPFLGGEIAVTVGVGGLFFEKIMQKLGLKISRKLYIFILTGGLFLLLTSAIRYKLTG
jgi:hypothetical protein